MSQSSCYAPNHPFVVSELIDGEVVVMNLKSGNYYSTRHTGALLWGWLEQGRTPESIAESIARIYDGEAAHYLPDITAFVDSLLAQGLISTVEASPPHLPGEIAANPPGTYQAPVLEVFADMQDLLLLDPIHDIDEVGWPVAKPTRPTA